jgi:hypothetical protein
MGNPNFQLLVDAAKLLKPILGELVFVGGCTTALLITDKGAAEVRPTYDVDAIAEITSYVEYAGFSEKLKALGFREDTREGAPLVAGVKKRLPLMLCRSMEVSWGSKTHGTNPRWQRRKSVSWNQA